MEQNRPRDPLTRSELREELEAVLRARQELGRDEEKYLIETFLQRLDAEIDARIDAKIGSRPAPRIASPTSVLTRVLVLAIPLSGIAGGIAHLPGLIVAWVAIALVAVVATHDRIGH